MEQFIEAVRSRPCLWDIHLPSYNDQELRDMAWDEIAKQCGMRNGRYSRKKWKNLKDGLRNALKRRVGLAESRQKYLWPYKYYNVMEFILPYMKNTDKPNVTNINPQKHGSSSSSTVTEDVEQGREQSLQKKSVKSVRERRQKKAKPNMDSSKRLPAFLREYQEKKVIHDQQVIAKRQELEQENPLLEFFKSMYNTARKLPFSSQLKIKRTLFNVVTEEEERHLATSDSSNQSPVCDTTMFMNEYILNTREPVIDVVTPSPSEHRMNAIEEGSDCSNDSDLELPPVETQIMEMEEEKFSTEIKTESDDTVKMEPDLINDIDFVDVEKRELVQVKEEEEEEEGKEALTQ